MFVPERLGKAVAVRMLNDDNRAVAYADDPVGYRERLVAKLRPEHVRATMAFAGLYQLTYEMIKQIDLDRVRDFFCLGAIGLDDVMTPKSGNSTTVK